MLERRGNVYVMYFTINDNEREALYGLPHLQQLAYLLGIRPYMDRKTFIVGVKRRISYQSIAESLYIEPHQGIQATGSIGRQQVRRAVNALERVGVVRIESVDRQLIIKCVKAELDFSTPKKADTRPTHQLDTRDILNIPNKTIGYDKFNNQDSLSHSVKANIPHQSESNSVFLGKQFEKFWQVYPQKEGRQRALDEFFKINPDLQLCNRILKAVQSQIESRKQCQLAGLWVPSWKYPANWLAQQCWNDEISLDAKETMHAKRQTNTSTKQSYDMYWESCKAGAELFDFEEEKKQPSNVIQFGRRI